MYKLKIATGTDLAASTCSDVSIVLVGLHGESEVHHLPHHWDNFISGAVTEFNITENKDLGELLFIRLSIEPYLNFHLDPWYCNYVKVTCPKGQLYQFPLYQWILKSVEIPEGKGIVITKNTPPVIQQQRQLELGIQRETHKWKVYAEGAPRCIDVKNNDPHNLPPNDQYSFRKQVTFGLASYSSGLEAKLDGYVYNTDTWPTLDDIKLVTFLRKSQYSGV
ncbi:hypothetical protein AB205_0137640 [Aquarana catesbeiana]|uniref:PLAT domain-containing protein n=1 Tax=Aquarana catesbeiana TaxID=8400 RepID=A0A2G9RD71_AQUCT|nr:hypothetical protein AB205_0137640 [Aquarana catesbeiana]